ncbi:MAG: SDR family NAD(P)-dependent oxidoreductase [Actinomycetota bacterium]|nr:SDR family NAD(P)-dependent oxidoreductase [Actinomycetota bacterium]MDD5666367.1 SDR family NAD(P)-dependent oxidoreductase [Actinomycetota bacterium]
MKDLAGKVVLITGGARGMGKLHARNFAREAARVVVTDLDESELEKTAAEMREAGYEVFPYLQDVSDREAGFELVNRVEAEVGPIDVLVNNAGITTAEYVMDTSESTFRRIIDVNYLGPVWMMHAVIPGMLARKRGHVVNVCSIVAKVAPPKLGAYNASKAALLSITDTIRQELKGSGVNFTIVNPGYIATGMFEGAKVPVITHWQDPQKVADALVDAVKKNKAEIFVPRFMTLVASAVRGLGLPRLVDLSFGTLGAKKSFESMHEERGRPF